MKPPFKAEMFHKYYPHLMSAEQAAEQANAIAESWPVVYGQANYHLWSAKNDCPKVDTHRARLAFIEPITVKKAKYTVSYEDADGKGLTKEATPEIAAYLDQHFFEEIEKDCKHPIIAYNGMRQPLEGKCKVCGAEVVAVTEWREKK